MDEPISRGIDDRPRRGRRSVLIGGAAPVAGLTIHGGVGPAFLDTEEVRGSNPLAPTNHRIGPREMRSLRSERISAWSA